MVPKAGKRIRDSPIPTVRSPTGTPSHTVYVNSCKGSRSDPHRISYRTCIVTNAQVIASFLNLPIAPRYLLSATIRHAFYVAFHCWDKYHDTKQLGRGKGLLILHVVPLSPPITQAGNWTQELTQRPRRNSICLLPLACLATFLDTVQAPTCLGMVLTHSGLGPPTSINN